MTLPYPLQLVILRTCLSIYARRHRLTPWERIRAVGMSVQYLSWCGSLSQALRTGASAIRTFAGGRILNRRPRLPVFNATRRRVAAMQLVGGSTPQDGAP